MSAVEIARIRDSFSIFLVDHNTSGVQAMLDTLKAAGYTSIKFFPTLDSALAMARMEPPHVVLFDYENFENSSENFLTDLKAISDEIQPVLMIAYKQTMAALQLVSRGLGYDFIVRPFISSLEITQKIDRAVARLYFQFESEQLREHLAETPAAGATRSEIAAGDAAQLGKKNLDESKIILNEATNLLAQYIQVKELDVTVQLFMESVSRLNGDTPIIYFKYLPAHATLAVVQTCWLPAEKFRGVGIDLKNENPKNAVAMLKDPNQFPILRNLVNEVFKVNKYTAIPHLSEDDLLGVFVVLAEIAPDKVESLKVLRQGFDLGWRKNVLLKEKHTLDILDPITGVFSRRHFVQKLDEEISRSRRILMPVSLVIFDIDGFKSLNERIGQQQGDSVLRAVATILKKAVRVNDFVGRTGHDEFSFVLPHTEAMGAAKKAELVRKAVEATKIPVLRGQPPLTLKAGVAEYPAIANDADSLVKAADQALGQVRGGGGNRVCLAVASPEFKPDFVGTVPKFTDFGKKERNQ